MRCELTDGRLHLHRTEEERQPLLQRLGRIEGQVRGLRQMVASDRYCGDELQLATAILAATREVMRLLVEQHIAGAISYTGAHPDHETEVMTDIGAVLRPLLRDQ